MTSSRVSDYVMKENTVPIATLDFNAEDVTTEEVGQVCNKIREIDGLVVFEQGHNETYTVARKEG